MVNPDDAQSSQRPRGVVPYNPDLHDLVLRKNQWQHGQGNPPQLPDSVGWKQRGYLPHRDEPGLSQFVTFRLADCFPAELRSEWQALQEIEEDRQRQRKLEGYLDLGRGSCHLRRPELAGLVETALRFCHGSRYDLRAWVVMPNHVHVLFTQRDEPLGKIVGSWKSYTAKEANKVLGRTGQFWEEDYWDTYMRDDAHELKTRRYVECNPVKAQLVRQPTQWAWSSARFRDEFERLRLPE